MRKLTSIYDLQIFRFYPPPKYPFYKNNFGFGSNPGLGTMNSAACLKSPLPRHSLLSLSLSFMTLTVLKSAGQLQNIPESNVFPWLDWGYPYWQEHRKKHCCVFLGASYQEARDVREGHYGPCSLGLLVTVVSARFLHYEDAICPFEMNTYFVGRHTLRYEDNLFLTKLSPTGSGVHWLFFLKIIITVMFVKWWYSNSITASTCLCWQSVKEEAFSHLLISISTDSWILN